jgi:polyisoprenoid-binding protein YceI
MVRVVAVATVLLSVGAAAAPPQQLARGDIRVLCPMTVGGSFEAKTTALSGSVPGELVVDLTTLDSGVSLRNEHMRNNYLEVGKGKGFDKAVMSDVRVQEGPLETVAGRVTFTATLSLHGTSRPVSGRAQVKRTGSGTHVEATFPLTLSDFGIAKPQYLGIGVKNEVQIRATFDLAP